METVSGEISLPGFQDICFLAVSSHAGERGRERVEEKEEERELCSSDKATVLWD